MLLFILALSIFGKEEAIYRIQYSRFTLGHIYMKVQPIGDTLLKFTLITQSSGFLARFYTINDTIETCVRKSDFSTVWYKKAIHEGKYRYRGEIKILADSGLAYYPDGKVLYTPIAPKDPLGFLYYLRTLELKEGKKMRVPYHFDRISALLKVEVQKKEPLKIPGQSGSYIAYKVVLLQKGKNIFRGKGPVFIWIDQKTRRILKLSYTSKFGKMNAYLEKVKGNFILN